MAMTLDGIRAGLGLVACSSASSGGGGAHSFFCMSGSPVTCCKPPCSLTTPTRNAPPPSLRRQCAQIVSAMDAELERYHKSNAGLDLAIQVRWWRLIGGGGLGS